MTDTTPKYAISEEEYLNTLYKHTMSKAIEDAHNRFLEGVDYILPDGFDEKYDDITARLIHSLNIDCKDSKFLELYIFLQKTVGGKEIAPNVIYSSLRAYAELTGLPIEK